MKAIVADKFYCKTINKNLLKSENYWFAVSNIELIPVQLRILSRRLHHRPNMPGYHGNRKEVLAQFWTYFYQNLIFTIATLFFIY